MFAGSKSYYLYGASSNEFKILPNHHMQYTMMKYAREHRATTAVSVVQIMIQMTQNIMAYGRKKVWGTY